MFDAPRGVVLKHGHRWTRKAAASTDSESTSLRLRRQLPSWLADYDTDGVAIALVCAPFLQSTQLSEQVSASTLPSADEAGDDIITVLTLVGAKGIESFPVTLAYAVVCRALEEAAGATGRPLSAVLQMKSPVTLLAGRTYSSEPLLPKLLGVASSALRKPADEQLPDGAMEDAALSLLEHITATEPAALLISLAGPIAGVFRALLETGAETGAQKGRLAAIRQQMKEAVVAAAAAAAAAADAPTPPDRSPSAPPPQQQPSPAAAVPLPALIAAAKKRVAELEKECAAQEHRSTDAASCVRLERNPDKKAERRKAADAEAANLSTLKQRRSAARKELDALRAEAEVERQRAQQEEASRPKKEEPAAATAVGPPQHQRQKVGSSKKGKQQQAATLVGSGGEASGSSSSASSSAVSSPRVRPSTPDNAPAWPPTPNRAPRQFSSSPETSSVFLQPTASAAAAAAAHPLWRAAIPSFSLLTPNPWAAASPSAAADGDDDDMSLQQLQSPAVSLSDWAMPASCSSSATAPAAAELAIDGAAAAVAVGSAGASEAAPSASDATFWRELFESTLRASEDVSRELEAAKLREAKARQSYLEEMQALKEKAAAALLAQAAAARREAEQFEQRVAAAVAAAAKAAEQRARDQQQVAKCVVCLTEPVEMVLMPCSHACTCVGCTQKLPRAAREAARQACPMCSSGIAATRRIFLP